MSSCSICLKKEKVKTLRNWLKIRKTTKMVQQTKTAFTTEKMAEKLHKHTDHHNSVQQPVQHQQMSVLGSFRSVITNDHQIQSPDQHSDSHLLPYNTLSKEWARNFVIGTVAAGSGRILSTPIQLLSVRTGSISNYLKQCIHQMKMVTPTFLKFAPAHALAFSLNDLFRDAGRIWDMPGQQEENYVEFVSMRFVEGALAGMLSQCIIHPFEEAQIRYHSYLTNHQVVSQFNGPLDFVRRTSGFGSLYRGLLLGQLNSIAYRAFLFGTYNSLRVKNPYRDSWDLKGISSKLLLAQTATTFGVMFSLPFHNIRRQVVTSRLDGIPLSSLNCLKQLGFRGLFQGFLAESLLRRTSGTMILVLYDVMQDLWNRHRSDLTQSSLKYS